MKKRLIKWLVVVFAILMIPFLGQFPWSYGDYIFAGIILFTLASIYEVTTKNMKNSKQKFIVAAVIFVIIFFILGWAASGPD